MVEGAAEAEEAQTEEAHAYMVVESKEIDAHVVLERAERSIDDKATL
jgi:hypothetical protein